ncbi:chloride channel protein [Pseudoxanthomonas winnipegensis]|uniref:chloride channel protein n=1 Tax=Pseudoxanthomonas winnipegensis TaxID=2480810 RepID=UPI001039BACC|nr:chloride channel protein [Pseudoxanthomonas winnipegensis]TBV76333.1 chloride channel protein [Pseudoxanthomonas winnipegensis]
MNDRYQPARGPHDGLWWQIALGVFVGQLMSAAVAGIAFLLLAGFAASQAEDAAKQLSRQLQQATRQAQSAVPPTPSYAPAPTRTRRPLSDDERCMGGRRLKRLPNGWQDLLHEPC